MKISDEKWKTCPTCNKKEALLEDAKYGCDCCKKEIRRNRNSIDHLTVTVFDTRGANLSRRLQFCSWECVLVGIEDLKCNYFIELPFLQFDTKRAGMTAKDFFKAIEAYNK